MPRPPKTHRIKIGNRVLMDSSNLRVGGGVQVAASLVDEILNLRKSAEMRQLHPWLAELRIEVSSQVAANLSVTVRDATLVVTPHKPWWSPNRWLGVRKTPYDLQLTVFGPRYGRKRAPITVTGIADGTSVFPWPEGVPRGGLATRIKRGIRGRVSRRLFSRETFLISESRALSAAFATRTGYDPERMVVIPNALNRAVVDQSLRQSLPLNLREGLPEGVLLLAYVARMYPHKNHVYLERLHCELKRCGVEARFVVTLTEDEWNEASAELRSACINVGIVPVAMISDLNGQCDGVIFPSLLESFSATPLEAMFANGLIFASDRPFVREVCGDGALYFDPLDPVSGARLIADTLADKDRRLRQRANAERVASAVTDSEARARAYIQLISALLVHRELNSGGERLVSKGSHHGS